MPKAGDRIVIEGSKLGQVRREGQVLSTVGSLMKVRWGDGTESMLSPGAGTVTVVPGRGKAAKNGAKASTKKAPAKKAAAKKTATRARAASKKATPAASKTGKKKTAARGKR